MLKCNKHRSRMINLHLISGNFLISINAWQAEKLTTFRFYRNSRYYQATAIAARLLNHCYLNGFAAQMAITVASKKYVMNLFT